jgi:hypothetical protein
MSCPVQDKVDAERWRALMSCQRVRVLGSARLGEENQHIGLELWENFPQVVPTNEQSKAALTKFVDTIRKRS